MSIKQQYARAFRTQLRHFPVWDIGARVSVGAYGTLEDGCFTKLGTLDEFSINVELEAPSNSAFWEFSSEGTRVIEAHADANVAENTAGFELQFQTAHSLYVRADQSRVLSMSNAAQVGVQLHTHHGWKRGHCFVSSVRVTASLVLMMNTRDGSSIQIRGATAAIAELLGGRLNAASSVSITGDAGLKSLGTSGAFYVDLMQVGLFGLRARGAARDADDVEVVALLDPLDDLP